MWTGVGVLRFFVVGTGMFLTLGTLGCRSPGTQPPRQPISSASTGEQVEKESAPTQRCNGPENFKVLGPGPHGELQVEQFVQCTPNRVLIMMPSMEQEWLLVRDGQDPAKLEGFLVLHRRKAIVRYPFDQLVIEGVASSWDALVSRLTQGGQSSEAGVNPAQLQAPALRFPGYRAWNLDAWRSAKHEPPAGHHHGPGGHHHGHGADGHGHGPGGHDHGADGHEHGPGGHDHGADGHEHGPGGHDQG